MPISTISTPNTIYQNHSSKGAQLFGCGEDALRCRNTVQFGAEAGKSDTLNNSNETSDKTTQADEGAKSGSLKDSISALLQDIRNAVLEGIESLKRKAIGHFQPTLAGISVLSHASAWNKVLKEINPDSKLQQRITTICDLAFVLFRDQSKAILNKDLQRENQIDPANQALIDDALELFPGLAKQSSLPGDYPLSRFLKRNKEAVEN